MDFSFMATLVYKKGWLSLFLFLTVYSGCDKPTKQKGDNSFELQELTLVRVIDGEEYSRTQINLDSDEIGRIINYEENVHKADGSSRLFKYEFVYEDDRCKVTRCIDKDDPYEELFIFDTDKCVQACGSDIFYHEDRPIQVGDTFLTWENGDCILSERPAGTCEFSYYTELDNQFANTVDMVFQFGLWTPEPLGYGFCGKGNQHLVKTADTGNDLFEWEYKFDRYDRLVGFTRTSSHEVLTASLAY